MELVLEVGLNCAEHNPLDFLTDEGRLQFMIAELSARPRVRPPRLPARRRARWSAVAGRMSRRQHSPPPSSAGRPSQVPL
mmetsp:Transcript_7612/g.24337  ORF Transcript_7612/g.24337 Transcript_7612/m.24337 type:complete len:80 (+) Transcript_7612:930-1169(+)